MCLCIICSFFFFNDTATTEIYTLSLHDALPISGGGAGAGPAPGRTGHGRRRPAAPGAGGAGAGGPGRGGGAVAGGATPRDRKSTRLNSSHANISYAVFCLKKKNEAIRITMMPRD